jgi:hypothetical protein
MLKESRIEEIVEFIETLKDLHGKAKGQYEKNIFRRDLLKYSKEYYQLTGKRYRIKIYERR